MSRRNDIFYFPIPYISSSSWEANSTADGQEIPRVLCNLKVHYRVHNLPGPYPEPDEFSPNPQILFFQGIFYIILPSTIGSSKRFFPSGFPYILLSLSCIKIHGLVIITPASYSKGLDFNSRLGDQLSFSATQRKRRNGTQTRPRPLPFTFFQIHSLITPLFYAIQSELLAM
jgi:hypothetical protein